MNSTVPPESARGLWYDSPINRFKDDSGAILNDLTPYFHTWMLDKWKRGKDYAVVRDRNGDIWELFYEHNPFDYVCNHSCHKCASRCEVYDLVVNEYELV